MFRSIIAMLDFAASVTASATTISEVSYLAAQTVLSEGNQAAGFNFHQGDKASYSLNISSFINGTMDISVKSVATDEVVLQQDVNAMGQAQSCTETINPNTGAVKSMVCNGQNQDAGNAGDYEVVESKEQSVTVPAGTFDTLYIKAHNKKDNNDVEQWINPKLIPVLGMAKMSAPTQMGQMVVELTSFKKN